MGLSSLLCTDCKISKSINKSRGTISWKASLEYNFSFTPLFLERESLENMPFLLQVYSVTLTWNVFVIGACQKYYVTCEGTCRFRGFAFSFARRTILSRSETREVPPHGIQRTTLMFNQRGRSNRMGNRIGWCRHATSFTCRTEC